MSCIRIGLIAVFALVALTVPSARADNWSDIQTSIQTSVVRITTTGKIPGTNKWAEPTVATGFFVDDSGVILTAYHTKYQPGTEGTELSGRTIMVERWDRNRDGALIALPPIVAKEIDKEDKTMDLLFIQIAAVGTKPVALCSDYHPNPGGEAIEAFGFPDEFAELVPVVGRLSNPTGPKGRWQVLLQDGPGMSGAPVTNREGAVVAMLVSELQVTSRVIPMKYARNLFPSMSPDKCRPALPGGDIVAVSGPPVQCQDNIGSRIFAVNAAFSVVAIARCSMKPGQKYRVGYMFDSLCVSDPKLRLSATTSVTPAYPIGGVGMQLAIKGPSNCARMPVRDETVGQANAAGDVEARIGLKCAVEQGRAGRDVKCNLGVGKWWIVGE